MYVQAVWLSLCKCGAVRRSAYVQAQRTRYKPALKTIPTNQCAEASRLRHDLELDYSRVCMMHLVSLVQSLVFAASRVRGVGRSTYENLE
jgi:hypothetical protein